MKTIDNGDAGFIHPASSHHAVPARTLLAVFGLLVGLTMLTVLVAGLASPSLEIWISLGIATVKAALVAIYFMHLREEKPFNILVIASSIVFVGLFLALTLADSHAYQEDIDAQSTPLDSVSTK